MQLTPIANRVHIAIFGNRNAGKSSLINCLTKQNIALVSPIAGTTTDPVHKTMELLPIGPVVIIDTAGIDDCGELGKKRVEKTMAVFQQTHLALLVVDAQCGFNSTDQAMLDQLKSKQIPTIVVFNKIDIVTIDDGVLADLSKSLQVSVVAVSAQTEVGIECLKQQMVINTESYRLNEKTIVGDLLTPNDIVVLVVPIDCSAPKGRLILPQVQTIRDILDHQAQCMVVQTEQLPDLLHNLRKQPKIVITDSQQFDIVAKHTPPEVLLTSFSILFARYKGNLDVLVEGVKVIDDLQAGDRILIAEACTHQCQSEDIGRVKIPYLLKQRVGGQLEIEWVAGNEFPKNVNQYKVIIHCGACMINRRQMITRLSEAAHYNIPVVNYGVLLAHIHGILERAIEPFGL